VEILNKYSRKSVLYITVVVGRLKANSSASVRLASASEGGGGGEEAQLNNRRRCCNSGAPSNAPHFHCQRLRGKLYMQNDNAAEHHAIVGGAASPAEKAVASSDTEAKLRSMMQETGLTQQLLDSSGTLPQFSQKQPSHCML
jgi:hypothetical protein